MLTNYKCVTCNACFYTSLELSCHIIKTHPEEKLIFPCLQCNNIFETIDERNTHHLNHTQKPYLCYYGNCNASFTKNKDILFHVMKFHAFKCPLCRSYVSACHWDNDEKHIFMSDICKNYTDSLKSIIDPSTWRP
jgi:hypothetical protein